MTPRTILLGGLLTVLLAAPTMAQEPARARDRRAPAEAADRGFDWTGAYAGVSVGAATGGGRVRDGRAADDADRYPPSRTRVRP